MTLYELKEQYLNAMNNVSIDEETGEIIGLEELETLEAEFDEKAESVALYIKNLIAEAQMIKAEEDNLKARRTRLTNKADRLEKYLSDMMVAAERDKMSTSKVEIKFTKSKRVEIGNESEFIEWATANFRTELLSFSIPKPNKTEIKKAIQSGNEVFGAAIVETKSINIK